MTYSRVIAAAAMVGGALMPVCVGCGNCDYDFTSQPQTLVEWRALRDDGTVLGGGCAIAQLGPGIGAGAVDVALAADVIKFSAKPGDIVTLQVRDWDSHVEYRGLCSPSPPQTDMKNSALFCGSSAVRSPLYLNACETSVSGSEPAVILSNELGDVASMYASVIKMRIQGSGVQHVVPHRRVPDATGPGSSCESAADSTLPTFSLFTVTAG